MAVFGLYGSATSKFDISPKLVESGAFESFWDTFAFVANGIVFFFAGASSLNFVIRYLASPDVAVSFFAVDLKHFRAPIRWKLRV